MKSFKISAFAVIITTIAGINIYKAKQCEKTDLLLANINAIAYGESFTWDGKTWNDTDSEHWFGSDWKPVLVDCTVTYGPPFYEISYQGKKVTCNNDPGNCLMASDCTNS